MILIKSRINESDKSVKICIIVEPFIIVKLLIIINLIIRGLLKLTLYLNSN